MAYIARRLAFLAGATHGDANSATAVFYVVNHRGDTLNAYVSGIGLIASYRYDAFGNVIEFSCATGCTNLLPRYTFSTKEYLPDAKVYLYAYRVYDPVADRWTQRDPIDYQDSVNLYCFCENCPLLRTDSHGDGTVRIWSTTSKVPTVLNDVNCQTLRDTIATYKDGTIGRIEIVGHGTREGIVFGPGGSSAALLLDNGSVRYSDSAEDDPSFSDTVRDKLAKGASIQLNGCHTANESLPWAFDNEHITKNLSRSLPGVNVTGNSGYTFSNELSLFWNRDKYFRIGTSVHAIGGFPITYRDGERVRN